MINFIRRLFICLIITSLLASITACTPDIPKVQPTDPPKKNGAKQATEQPTVKPTQKPIPDAKGFADNYTYIDGVLCFRGNNLRTSPSFGTANLKKFKMTQVWKNFTPARNLWGGGAGWTGQPAIVKWSPDVRKMMNIKPEFKKDNNFVEVIQASLNGRIYFYDLYSGKETREPIDLVSTIKGSVSVDPRGYPLLYIGQGIKENSPIGFHIINLINGKSIYFQNGEDPNAPRTWPAFDSNAIFDKDEDTMYVGGENGLFYKLKLNTKFDKENKTISVNPKTYRYSTNSSGTKFNSISDSIGIENSVVAYGDRLYFSDNGGVMRCLDLDLKEVWSYKNIDDTDATPVIDLENGKPMVYTGCQVDKQGAQGTIRFVKLDGKSGKVIWKRDFKGYNRDGASPSNGGFLGTPVVGKKEIGNLILFYICRHPEFASGKVFALDKETGKTVWSKKMPTYSWPSPVDIYDEDGNGYLLCNDHDGTVWLFNAKTGKVLFSEKVDNYLEASPAVYNNHVVFAGRSGNIYCYELK